MLNTIKNIPLRILLSLSSAFAVLCFIITIIISQSLLSEVEINTDDVNDFIALNNTLKEFQDLQDVSRINSVQALGFYDHLDKNEVEGKIITDYYWMTVLPGFEGSTERIFFENDRFIILSNSDSYELVDPNTLVDENTFGFFISDMYYKDEVFRDIFRSKISSSDYIFILSKGGYSFLKVNK